MSQGMQAPPHTGKGQEAGSTLEPPEGIGRHLDFSHKTPQAPSLRERMLVSWHL